MQWAIAGATGFIGQRLLTALRVRGTIVKPLTRADLSPDRIASSIGQCTVLINCAGEKTGIGPVAEFANVTLPRLLFEHASSSEVGCFIHLSSVAAIANVTSPGEKVKDPLLELPTNKYGLSKRIGDSALIELAHKFQHTSLTIIRPPMIIGRNAPGVFPLLASAARMGVPLPLRGSNNLRSIMHVDNLVAALIAGAEQRLRGVFIVTDSEPMSTEEIYRRMLIASGFQGRFPSAGTWGRTALRKILGRRGESLFGNAAFDGSEFKRKVGLKWPIIEEQLIEAALND